jgi:FO synthase
MDKGKSMSGLVDAVRSGVRIEDDQARSLMTIESLDVLTSAARALRDASFGNLVTFSPKVFIPLTHLCRDVCHYCTFARAPRNQNPYLTLEQVLDVARAGQQAGCHEALFTLGEKPELRYPRARRALAEMGYETTIDYLVDAAGAVLKETGLLPHVNPGVLDADEISRLREVSVSGGMMLESTSERLCLKGGPHYGSPDKAPAVRLRTLDLVGESKVPFTTGILIGIGETRAERIDALLAIRATHERHGQIQEVIVQNFRAKANTAMADAPEPSAEELVWTIAIARLILGSEMSIQAPPNLSPGALGALLDAGINDWGGVSPVTPDHVNPEAPWPHLDILRAATEAQGKRLAPRLPVYPKYLADADVWMTPTLRAATLRRADADGLGREDLWLTGDPNRAIPARPTRLITEQSRLTEVLNRAADAEGLSEADSARLFQARGSDVQRVCDAADQLRASLGRDEITYVVNRNINYTNVCGYHCKFCAFSKGRTHEDLRGKPYDLAIEEIVRRAMEAYSRGATEVCLQGGIHPDYTGETYLEICRAIRAAAPGLHIHAFSPLEVSQGAHTLGLDLATYLTQLRDAGLSSLPGTAAEILDDEVRDILCADKVNTEEWLNVMRTAHQVGLRTTSTIMFGHVDRTEHWARHIARIAAVQRETGGFTEFVPLPFVAKEAPIFRRGQARQGPTFREALLVHAVARLAFGQLIDNIQTSWVKMGPQGTLRCLQAGANDLGGTLMNESITRAAGAAFGEELPPSEMEELARTVGRTSRLRTTFYGEPPQGQKDRAFQAAPLAPLIQTPVKITRRA